MCHCETRRKQLSFRVCFAASAPLKQSPSLFWGSPQPEKSIRASRRQINLFFEMDRDKSQAASIRVADPSRTKSPQSGEHPTGCEALPKGARGRCSSSAEGTSFFKVADPRQGTVFEFCRGHKLLWDTLQRVFLFKAGYLTLYVSLRNEAEIAVF